MLLRSLLSIASVVLLVGLTWPVRAESSEPVARLDFPAAEPAEVGLDPRGLDRLDQHVRGLVEQDAIVGGELLVIQNRWTVLRRAYGWKDRQREASLDVDALYCVRSMTKPLVGTAIQMLIDEGRLSLADKVHRILPSFSGAGTEAITVEHLLTHASGLPFTTFTRPLDAYPDLSAVAAEAAAGGLEHPPGDRFLYSDAGSDTLGAIVEAVSGQPIERFLASRLLQPVGMTASATSIADPDVAARVPTAYSGGTGAWIAHWRPEDPPIFPLFLTSQSLYSTTEDYARFLALWMDGGRIGERRLLSAEAVERALTPRFSIGSGETGFPRLGVHYGHQWMLYATTDDAAPHVTAFGHNGSDGTFAWAWPERDLMVLFFTQSRGTLVGAGLEGVIHSALIEPTVDDSPSAEAGPSIIPSAAGIYWDEDVEEAYYVVHAQGDRWVLERPGRMRMVFKPDDSAEPVSHRLLFEVNPAAWIELAPDDSGTVPVMKTFFGRRVEHDPRHVPDPSLPSVEEVTAAVQRAHRLDRLAELGVVRSTGRLTIEARRLEASFTAHFDASRSRTEVQADAFREVTIVDAPRAWSEHPMTGVAELDGIRREQAVLDRWSVTYGNWAEHFRHVEVLKRVQLDDRAVLLVRVVPDEAPGATFFVDEATGRVVRSEGLAHLPGLGIVGVRTDYDDFREVDGMVLPFRSTTQYRSQMVGRIVVQWTEAETGVEVADEFFSPSGSE